jgi:hypothetical protein
MGLVRHVTILELPNRALHTLAPSLAAASKSLHFNILPISHFNTIFCRDFLVLGFCFQYFAVNVGEGGITSPRSRRQTANLVQSEGPFMMTDITTTLDRGYENSLQRPLPPAHLNLDNDSLKFYSRFVIRLEIVVNCTYYSNLQAKSSQEGGCNGKDYRN